MTYTLYFKEQPHSKALLMPVRPISGTLFPMTSDATSLSTFIISSISNVSKDCYYLFYFNISLNPGKSHQITFTICRKPATSCPFNKSLHYRYETYLDILN